MKSTLLLMLLQLTLFSCYSQDCKSLPNIFTSYEQAKSQVKKAHFKYSDKANTSESSWIRGASYYSCVGQTGYLILLTDRSDYIHSRVPISVWREFKNAASLGTYYNANIKHRYQLKLN